jgi:hypothetical protein
MEPISVSIVTALAAGAGAAAKDVATEAIKDAYAGLKKFLLDHYHHAGPQVEAVAANPGSEDGQKALANQLTGVSSDPEAKKLTEALLDALRELQNNPKAQAVFDFGKLRAARNFELNDIHFSGTLFHADEAVFEGDFKATGIHQDPNPPRGN